MPIIMKENIPMDKILEGEKLISQAQREDSRAVWEIRNHSKNRPLFNNSEPIEFEQHDEWFENQYFSDKGNICFVLKSEGKVIGYCRFDLKDNQYLISIALAPEYQGKGLGNTLLAESLKSLGRDREILAEIKKDNDNSIKLFERNNFEKYSENEKDTCFRYKTKQFKH